MQTQQNEHNLKKKQLFDFKFSWVFFSSFPLFEQGKKNA